MKKLVSFCLLSVLIAALSLMPKMSYGQTSPCYEGNANCDGCCLTLTNVDTALLHYERMELRDPRISQTDLYKLEFINGAGLDPMTQISISWEVYRDGSLMDANYLGNRDLSWYANMTLLSRYTRINDFLLGSMTNGLPKIEGPRNQIKDYPGAVTTVAGTSPMHYEDLFGPGGAPVPYSLDFYYLHFFMATDNYLQIKWNQPGDYKIVLHLVKRCGGTDFPSFYYDETQHLLIGGHSSLRGDTIASIVLEEVVRTTMSATVCFGETYQIPGTCAMYTFDKDTVVTVPVYNITDCDNPCKKLDSIVTLTLDVLDSIGYPDVDLTHNFCQKEIATLTAVPDPSALTVEWKVNDVWEETNTISVKTDTVAGTYFYYVRQKLDNGTQLCYGDSAEITVIINELPASLGNQNVGYCLNDQAVALTATPDQHCEVQWLVEGVWTVTAPAPATTSAGTTEYLYRQQNTMTECIQEIPDTAFVYVYALPVLTITANPNDTVCPNTVVALTAAGAEDYVWNTGATTASIDTLILSNATFTVTGTVTHTHAACSNTATINIVMSPAPTVKILQDTICENADATLVFTGKAPYTLYASASIDGGVNFYNFAPPAGSYPIHSTTDTFQINVPVAGLVIMRVDSLFDGNAAFSADGRGCRTEGLLDSIVTTYPTVNIVERDICVDNQAEIVFTGKAPYTLYYKVNGNDPNSIGLQNPLTSNSDITHIVGGSVGKFAFSMDSLFDGKGCINILHSIIDTVDVHPLPNVEIVEDTICVHANANLILTGTPPFEITNILVNGTSGYAGLASSVTVNALIHTLTINDEGDFTVTATVTDAWGCERQVTDNLLVTPRPSAIIVEDKICQGDEATIQFTGTAPFDLSYRVSLDTGITFVLPSTIGLPDDLHVEGYDTTLIAGKGGIFVFRIFSLTDATGCGEWEHPEHQLEVVPTPIPTYSYAPDISLCDNNICNGALVQIQAFVKGNINYYWLENQDPRTFYTHETAILNIHPINNGIVPDTLDYRISIFNLDMTSPSGQSNGCSYVDTVRVIVWPYAYPEIVANADSLICEGEILTLTVTNVFSAPNNSYQWYKNGVVIPGATTASLVVDTAAVYRVNFSYKGHCETNNLCSGSDEYEVFISPAPKLKFNDFNDTLCSSQSINIVATDTNQNAPSSVTYVWYDVAGGTVSNNTYSLSNVMADITEPDDIYITLSASYDNGCITDTAFHFIINPRPDVLILTDYNEICAGMVDTLQGLDHRTYTTNVMKNFIWESNAKNDECTQSNSSYVPPVWSSGTVGTTEKIAPVIKSDTAFRLTIVNSYGCSHWNITCISLKDSVSVDIVGQDTACFGEDVLFYYRTSNAITAQEWYLDNTLAGTNTTYTARDLSVGKHTVVLVAQSNDLCPDTASYTLEVLPLLSVYIAEKDICAGDSAHIHFAGGTAPYTLTYRVNGVDPSTYGLQDIIVSTTGNNAIVGGLAGNFAFEVVSLTDANDNSCFDENYRNDTVLVRPLLSVKIEEDTICAGHGAQINFAGGTAPYTLTYKVNAQLPSFYGLQDTIVSGNGIEFITGGQAGKFTFEVLSLTDANDNSCFDTVFRYDSVFVRPQLTVSFTEDSICEGTDAHLNIIGGTGPYFLVYALNDGQNDTILNAFATNPVSFPATGIRTAYTIGIIEIRDATGNECLDDIDYEMIVNPLPTVSINEDIICVGNEAHAVLTGIAPFTLFYQVNGQDPSLYGLHSPIDVYDNNLTLVINDADTFIVTVTSLTDATGCENTNVPADTIIVIGLPTIDFTSNPTGQFCAGDDGNEISIILNPITAAVSWVVVDAANDTVMENSTNVALVEISNTLPAGTYTVIATATLGTCDPVVDSTTFTILPLPVITFATSNVYDICSGGSTTLAVVPQTDATYAWTPATAVGGTDTAATYTRTLTGKTSEEDAYETEKVFVTATLNGCEATDSTKVVKTHYLPNVSIIAGYSEKGKEDTVCVNENFTANAMGHGQWSYTWSNGGASTKTPTLTFSTAGNAVPYTVTATTTFGCSATASRNVAVQDLPDFTLKGKKKFCFDRINIDSVQVTPTTTPVTIVWSGRGIPKVTDNSIFYPDTTAWVVVTVTNAAGCDKKDSIYVEVTDKPYIDIVANGLVDVDSTVEYTANIVNTYNVIVKRNCYTACDAHVALNYTIYYRPNETDEWKAIQSGDDMTQFFSNLSPAEYFKYTFNSRNDGNAIGCVYPADNVMTIPTPYFNNSPSSSIPGEGTSDQSKSYKLGSTYCFSYINLHFLYERPISVSINSFSKNGYYKVSYTLDTYSGGSPHTFTYNSLGGPFQVGGDNKGNTKTSTLASRDLFIHISNGTAASEYIPATSQPQPLPGQTAFVEPAVVAFPNPTLAELNLKVENSPVGQATVNIYDSKGQLMETFKANVPQSSSVISHKLQSSYTDGLYVVKVQVSEAIMNTKIIIKK